MKKKKKKKLKAFLNQIVHNLIFFHEHFKLKNIASTKICEKKTLFKRVEVF